MANVDESLNRVEINDADKIIRSTVNLILEGNIDKFKNFILNRFNFVNNIIIYGKICLILFENIDNKYTRFGIREIFIHMKPLRAMICVHLDNIFNSKQKTIDYLLIDYRDPITYKFYEARCIQSTNVDSLLRYITEIYGNIIETPLILDIICMCYDRHFILDLFNEHHNLYLPIVRHIIFRQDSTSMNSILRNITPCLIETFIKQLNVKYCDADLINYNNNINIIINKFGYSCKWKPVKPYHGATYLYECLILLIEDWSIERLFMRDSHMIYMNLFEVCCNGLKNGGDNKLYHRRIRNDCRILIRVLSKKGLIKYMEKFGAYESPDNLNDCRVADMILTFI